MSRQRKHGWAAYSRPEIQWMKKDFEVAFDVFLNVAEESEQGTKDAGGAVP